MMIITNHLTVRKGSTRTLLDYLSPSVSCASKLVQLPVEEYLGCFPASRSCRAFSLAEQVPYDHPEDKSPEDGYHENDHFHIHFPTPP